MDGVPDEHHPMRPLPGAPCFGSTHLEPALAVTEHHCIVSDERCARHLLPCLQPCLIRRCQQLAWDGAQALQCCGSTACPELVAGTEVGGQNTVGVRGLSSEVEG